VTTEVDIDALPYRPCVGLMVLNRDGRVFTGLDAAYEVWQMPQGGIEKGETPRDTAIRELTEETSIRADRARILRESAHWLPYDAPRHLVPTSYGGRYRGQTQRWFALTFLGEDSEIDVETEEPEFREWRWMQATEVIENAFAFKRQIYEHVFDEFADLCW